MNETDNSYQLAYLDPKSKITLIITLTTLAIVGLIIMLQLKLMLPVLVTVLAGLVAVIALPICVAYWYYLNKMLQMVIEVQPDNIVLKWPQMVETNIPRESILWAQYGLPRWKNSMIGRERLLIKTLDEVYEIHSCVFDDAGRQNLHQCYNEIKTVRDPVYNTYWS